MKVYIVKRRLDGSNPSHVPATSVTEWEYLGLHGRWSSKFDSARVFTDKGHAKNALKHMPDEAGQPVLIQPYALAARCGGEVWIVS